LPVHLSPVCDSRDDHEPLRIVDCIYDPIVADPNAEVISPGELDGSWWSRVDRETVDRRLDSVAERAL
jgi:hypothetical protein